MEIMGLVDDHAVLLMMTTMMLMLMVTIMGKCARQGLVSGMEA